MGLPALPTRHADSEAHRQRISETVNGITSFQFDDSRVRTGGEIDAEVLPVNLAYPPYSSKRHKCTANNVVDDTDPLQAMLNSAMAASVDTGGAVKAIIDSSDLQSFRCDGELSYDMAKVSLDGQGSMLNFENHADAFFVALKVYTSQQDINLGAIQHNMRPLQNILIQLPDKDVVNNAEGIRLVDETSDGSGNYRFSSPTLTNISILGGAFGLVFHNGVFAANIFNFCATSQGSNSLGVAIYAPSPWTDGQEACKFFGGIITGAVSAITLRTGSVYIFGMNIDGCPNIGTLENQGTLRFSGGYSEFVEGDDFQYKFNSNDANATLELIDWEFNVRNDVLAARTYPFAQNLGRFVLRNVHFYTGTPGSWFAGNSGFLLSGSGRAYASGIRYTGISPVPLVSRALQWLAYPDINNANALAAFTLSNSGAFNPVRALAVTGRDAIKFQINNTAASGSFSRAVFSHAVIPGRHLAIVGDYIGSLTGSNVIAECTVTYKDKAGNTIGTATTTTLPSTAAVIYELLMVDGGFVLAGAETVDVQIQTRATAIASANTTWYISPLGIGYADGE